jgi:hypothetical protein
VTPALNASVAIDPTVTSAGRMWPISTRVNKPENNDPSIVEPIELSAA